MIMNPNILNKNPLMFFDRAVNAQRSQLLTVMADAVSECRTAADQAAEFYDLRCKYPQKMQYDPNEY